MALQIKRGDGSPASTLADGEPYQDKDTGDLYIGLDSENLKFEGVGKRYRALISQSGTSNPDETELLNTTGETIKFYRDSAGVYRCALATGFDVDKTVIFITNSCGTSAVAPSVAAVMTDSTTLMLYTRDGSAFADDILTRSVLEVIIYN